MPAAILRESVSSRSNVDTEKGIVYGCRLAEIGKLAVFADKDGNRVELMVTPRLAQGLLDICAADQRLSAHWTHAWVMGAADPLESRVATWRNFRIEDGKLISDAFLWDGPRRSTILSAAETDPDGIMVSMVFDYTGGRDNPVAQSVSAADFVAKGAATTALCAAVLSAFSVTTKQTAKMADPAIPPEDTTPDPAPAAPFTPEQVTALQQMITQIVNSIANPTQMDDATMPAMMAAIRKEAMKAADSRFKEVETKVATLAEAGFTKAIGNSPALLNFHANNPAKTADNDFDTAVTAALSANLATVKDRASAIRFVAANKPNLYNAHMSGK